MINAGQPFQVAVPIGKDNFWLTDHKKCLAKVKSGTLLPQNSVR